MEKAHAQKAWKVKLTGSEAERRRFVGATRTTALPNKSLMIRAGKVERRKPCKFTRHDPQDGLAF
jgi:hypothetical protein